MSSAVTSNQNLLNFVVSNEQVNSAQVMNALNPGAFQTVQYESIVNPLTPISFTGPSSVEVGTAMIYNLTAEDLVQGVTTQSVVIAGAGTYPSNATTLSISLGSDTAANAEALISVLNLSQSNPFVVTHFHQWVAGGAGGASLNVNLVNAAAPTSYGTYVVFPSGSTGLFVNTSITTPGVTPVRFEYNSASQVTVRVNAF